MKNPFEQSEEEREEIGPIEQPKDSLTLKAKENFEEKLRNEKSFNGLVEEFETIVNQDLPIDYLNKKG